MAAHSSVLAWRLPGTGEPGGLPSMELHRVGHDWSDLAAAATYKSLSKIITWVSKSFHSELLKLCFSYQSTYNLFQNSILRQKISFHNFEGQYSSTIWPLTESLSWICGQSMHQDYRHLRSSLQNNPFSKFKHVFVDIQFLISWASQKIASHWTEADLSSLPHQHMHMVPHNTVCFSNMSMGEEPENIPDTWIWSFIGRSQKWCPITFALCFWLEAYH